MKHMIMTMLMKLMTITNIFMEMIKFHLLELNTEEAVLLQKMEEYSFGAKVLKMKKF